MGSVISDIVDFGGDVLGGAGDLIGSAADAVGNVVEDIDPETLAKIAYTVYTGDPSLAFEDMGEEALADAVINQVGDYTTDPSNWMDYLDTSNIGSDVLTDVGSNGFDPNSFLPGNNPYDPIKDIGNYTRYAKDAYSLYNQLNPDQQSQIQNQYQQQGLYDPNAGQSFNYGDILNNALNYGQQSYNTGQLFNSFQNIGNSASLNAVDPTSGGGSIIDLLKNLPYNAMSQLLNVPGLLGTGLGIASVADQKRVNNLVQKGYDTNQAKQLAAEQRFTTPEGIASLPKQNITGLTPRTVSDVVSKPKAAKGGSINDLYGEYSELNNRMRNYRRLAKGGLI
jgi:hypothetical protein